MAENGKYWSQKDIFYTAQIAGDVLSHILQAVHYSSIRFCQRRNLHSNCEFYYKVQKSVAEKSCVNVIQPYEYFFFTEFAT